MKGNSPHRMFVRLWVTVALVGLATAPSQAQTASPDPEAIAIFPLGGGQGSVFRAEVRARHLQGAHSVYFDTPDIQGRILQVGEIELEELEPPPGETTVDRAGQKVHLEIRIPDSAQPGATGLRLVGSRGITNRLLFFIHSLPQLQEQEAPHHKPTQSQFVPLPVVVNGRIRKGGETDYYSFQVPAGEELIFQVHSRPPERQAAGGWDPYLALYQPAGSWFDSDRARRLAYNNEPTSQHITAMPHLSYRFPRAGTYLVEVGAESGQGGPHGSYQLQIVPARMADRLIGWKEGLQQEGWPERRFDRSLGAEWIDALQARTVEIAQKTLEDEERVASGAAAAGPGATRDTRSFSGKRTPPVAIHQSEDEDLIPQLSLPALIEGRIESPGDVDRFLLRVETGDRLAFEVETPDTAPPHFNPHLSVIGGAGEELFSNVYKRIHRNFTFYLKTMEAKTVYTFLRGGDFTLQIRDVTHQYGDPSFRYRVLVRPQIPHVGAIQVDADRLNLVIGQARKFLVTTDQEESFAGEVALRLENLPSGVQLFPATRVQPEQGPQPDEGPKERFLPKKDETTLVLLAAAETPPSQYPHWIRVLAHPVVEGVLGVAVEVTRLPLVVIPPFRESAAQPSEAIAEKSP